MLGAVKVVTDNHSWQLVSRGCVYYACARSLRVLQAPTSRWASRSGHWKSQHLWWTLWKWLFRSYLKLKVSPQSPPIWSSTPPSPQELVPRWDVPRWMCLPLPLKGKPDRSALGFLYAMAPDARSLLGGNRRSGFLFLSGFTSSALSPLLMVLTLIQVIWLLVFKVKLKAKPILTRKLNSWP